MSAEFVICVYRPKSKGDPLFREALEEHLDVLDQGGYLASRQHLVMESEKDGAILELLEWKSKEAAGHAHNDPNVQAVWGKLSESAELLALKDLSEAGETFPHFRGYVPPESAGS